MFFQWYFLWRCGFRYLSSMKLITFVEVDKRPLRAFLWQSCQLMKYMCFQHTHLFSKCLLLPWPQKTKAQSFVWCGKVVIFNKSKLV